MHMATHLAGFTRTEADHFRKGIKLKDASKIKPWRDKFVEGCKIHSSIKKDIALKIWAFIEKFAGYGFNKCLSGRTILHRAGGNQYSPPQIAIKELYDKWNSKTPHGKKLRRQGVEILQLDDDGRIRPRTVKAVHENGWQRVYRVTTYWGKSIVATGNHRLLTEDGYYPVLDLEVGDKLICRGMKETYQKVGRNKGKVNSYVGCGFPEGKQNPSYIDGRTIAFNDAKCRVLKRSNSRCEKCGRKQYTGDRFEFAHMKTFEQCEGRYEIYHNKKNIKHLCNSCHKTYDYRIGVRKKRWSKGLPSVAEKIVSITPVGEEMTYDVEMDTVGHNFVADGIVSHNSHAASYGVLAYLTAWLKVHYLKEYMCALLSCNANDDDKLYTYILDMRKEGIIIVQPSINKSTKQFNIVKKGLMYPLNAVKQVGNKALDAILTERDANGSFDSFENFYERVDKRLVNVGVMTNLILAGAFRKFGKREALFDELMGMRKDAVSRQLYCKQCNKRYPISKKYKEIVDNGTLCPNCADIDIVVSKTNVFKKKYRKAKFDVSYINNHVFGFTMQDCQLKQFTDVIVRERCRPLDVVEDVSEGVMLKVAFEVSKVKKHRDKNGGLMAFLDITDGKYDSSLTVFAGDWEHLKEIVTEGGCYVGNLVKNRDKYLFSGYKGSTINKLAKTFKGS